jgi:hypothetical protein
MFTIVVIAVAIGVVTMYVRHELYLRRKRRAELPDGSPRAENPARSSGDDPPPTTKPP